MSPQPQDYHYLNADSAPWLTKHVSSILAIAALGLSFVLFLILIYTPLDPNKKDIIIYILGVLSAIDTQIVSFYFGSSKESEVKNRLISHQLINKEDEAGQ